MKLTLAAVEDVLYFRAKAEDIKDAVKEKDLADVSDVDLVVDMEGE